MCSSDLNSQVGYNSGNDKTPNMSNNLLYKSTDGTEEEVVDMTGLVPWTSPSAPATTLVAPSTFRRAGPDVGGRIGFQG